MKEMLWSVCTTYFDFIDTPFCLGNLFSFSNLFVNFLISFLGILIGNKLIFSIIILSSLLIFNLL